MAPFPPAVRRAMLNFQLRMDVEDLRGAYRAALTGLQHRQSEIEIFVRDRLAIGPEDPWPDPDENDPDDPVTLLYEQAGEMDAQAERGALMVRRAFLIALFHLWERHSNNYLKREHYDHNVVRKYLIRYGHAKAVDSIRRLQLAANCAKHSSGDSCLDLFKLYPSFFPRLTSGKPPNERALAIDGDDIEKFFDLVRSVAA